MQTKTPVSPHQDDETATGESGHGKGNRSSEATTISAAAAEQIHSLLEAGKLKQAIKLLESQPQLVHARAEHNQRTPLHTASSRGQFEMVQFLVEHGADVDAIAYEGGRFTPLYLAKDPDIVKYLLEHGANAEATTQRGSTALQAAARRYANAHISQFSRRATERDQWGKIVTILLDAGAEYDISSACCLGDVDRVQLLAKGPGQAADAGVLCMAAKYGHSSIVKILLTHGADPNANCRGMPLSYFAIAHPEALKLMLDAGADPRARVDTGNPHWGPYDSTVIHEAVDKGVFDSVRLLLARGASVDTANTNGTTVLQRAALRGELDIVKLLLHQGAKMGIANGGGWTAISLAADRIRFAEERVEVEENARLKAIIKLLLAKGQPLDLFTAIALGRTEAVRSILKKQPELANSTTNSYEEKSALHRAVDLNHKQIVAVLLEAGADVNGSDWLGETALHTAAYKGHVESAKLLIAHRADVNATDESGNTPLHNSALGCTLAMARLLLGAGANTNVKNDDGEIPLDAAKRVLDGDRHPQSKVKAMIRLLQKHQK